MDQITKSFLHAHKSEYGIEEYSDEKAFEHFSNRCIINKYTTERFDPSDLMTGPGEVGIDGIAISVNDHLILSVDEWESVNKDVIEARFVFIQAKTSEKFDGSEIGTFISGVKSFFAPNDLRFTTNRDIESLVDIKNRIFQSSINFKRKPSVELYYVCCGKWSNDKNLQERINLDLQELKNNPSFSNVTFYAYDADKIQTAYRELKKKISKQFVMEKRVSFSQIEGIKQAYIGLVKCKDYVSILKDSDGNMLTNIFEDNVRDFQGYNQVNSEIRKTISDTKDQHRFPILNNGITIVTKGIDIAGDLITIHDYQIVNGCQTSYVLFNSYELLDDESFVVVKIIEIIDDKISDRVIFTTNRQTEVKSEAFISIDDFQKGLESYYNSVPIEYRLYYERRSKQYELNDEINKNKVVTIPSQIKAFYAMFLNEPQSVHRYYGELLESAKEKMFREGDSFELYYISAYYQYLINTMFVKGEINKKYKHLKSYILFAMRILICDDKIVFGNRKSQEKIAKHFMDVIHNNDEFSRYLQSAITCLDESIKDANNITPNEIHRSKDLTTQLIIKCKQLNGTLKSKCYLSAGDKIKCVIRSISKGYINVELRTTDTRKNGSIRIDKNRNAFKVGQEVEAEINSGEYNTKYGWNMSLL